MARASRRTRVHRGALVHFLKVTRSDWPGRLPCYADADLPRTHNDLEHVFGAHRDHERRASARRRGAPGVVVHGAVRVIAAAATRVQRTTGPDLAPRDLVAWRGLRTEQDRRRELRTFGRRFRRHPEQYLASLEALLIKQTLPS